MKTKTIYFLLWLITIDASCWLHEFTGHYVTNLIAGISHTQMTLAGLHIGAVLVVPLRVDYYGVEIPRISLFMGGAVAAIVLFALSSYFYILFKQRNRKLYLALFSITLGVGCFEIFDMITEAYFPSLHISQANLLIIFPLIIGVPILVYHIIQKRYSDRTA